VPRNQKIKIKRNKNKQEMLGSSTKKWSPEKKKKNTREKFTPNTSYLPGSYK
jgi:hypothetical protein